jgi:hypothetical protein
MLKRIALTGLTIATVFSGARLTLAAFAPVLPPGFDAWTDESYDITYFTVRWIALDEFRYLKENGRWARDLPELLDGFASNDYWQGLSIDTRDGEVLRIRYSPPESRYVCRFETDRAHGEAYVRRPNYSRWRHRPAAEPAEISIHGRTECRRSMWPWTWLAWAGLDRLTEPPPERYASTDYIERASGVPR